MAKDYKQRRESWIPGTTIGQKGNDTFDVETKDGTIHKRHSDQLLSRGDSETPKEECEEAQQEICNEPAQVSERRYLEKIRHPPDRYGY